MNLSAIRPLSILVIPATLILLTVNSFSQNSINKAALDRFLSEAKKSHSDAVVIFKDGKLYGEWYFDKKQTKIETMSVTKSIVNLAIGRLITEGKIKSIDQPVYEFFPEWKQGQKNNITLKHLLNHTSGLQNEPNTSIEIYPSSDFVKLALAAELSSAPGSGFAYNNKAVNLIAGIVLKASGKRMDVYLKDELFIHLGITDIDWTLDNVGNPHAMSGLQIFPSDLAKLGQLVLNKGKWNGKQLINESWFELSMRPGQEYEATCGLLWWLIYDKMTAVIDDAQISKLEAKGVKKEFVEKAKTLIGRYNSQVEYTSAVHRVFGENWRDIVSAELLPLSLRLSRREPGNLIGYSANGYLGQYIFIYPRQNLVIVRMIGSSDSYSETTDSFNQIEKYARELVQVDGASK